MAVSVALMMVYMLMYNYYTKNSDMLDVFDMKYPVVPSFDYSILLTSNDGRSACVSADNSWLSDLFSLKSVSFD